MYEDTSYKGILDVVTSQLGTNDCILTAVAPVSRNNLGCRQFSLTVNAIVCMRKHWSTLQPELTCQQQEGQ